MWGGVREERTSTGVRLGRREEVEDMLGKERICRLTAAGRKTVGEELDSMCGQGDAFFKSSRGGGAGVLCGAGRY